VVLGKMFATAIGDALFGFLVYLLFVKPDLVHFALFTLLTFAVAFLFVGFSILTSSLSFYLGNAAGLAEQWRFAMITFSTYPATLFEGPVKLLLYTLIPAGFVSYLPVQALRNLSLADAGLTLLGAIGVVAAGVAVFYHGLSQYESGNLMLVN
jgi:ABC-2 type transport system permease protein